MMSGYLEPYQHWPFALLNSQRFTGTPSPPKPPSPPPKINKGPTVGLIMGLMVFIIIFINKNLGGKKNVSSIYRGSTWVLDPLGLPIAFLVLEAELLSMVHKDEIPGQIALRLNFPAGWYGCCLDGNGRNPANQLREG